MATWWEEYSEAARAEGWDLFDAGGEGFEVQHIPEAGVFSDDLTAVRYVIERAKAGSQAAIGAIRLALPHDCLVQALCRTAGFAPA